MKSRAIAERSIDLILTSPPFALTKQKDYGNEPYEGYLRWFESFLDGFDRVLADTGSVLVDVGGAYLPGRPVRSTYHFELALLLAKRFELCQEFYWFNPAKLPTPAEYTNIRRNRVKDSVNLVLWLARDASNTLADNRRVLKNYSDSMRSLLKNGYQMRWRPSNHRISDKFGRDNSGSIPANLVGFVEGRDGLRLEGKPFELEFDNLLSIANTGSTDLYLRKCAEHGVKPHGARFPLAFAAFFIQFLTREGGSVLDPFAGSNTTGAAAEALGRRWVSCELDGEGDPPGTYVRASAFRFPYAHMAKGFQALPSGAWAPRARKVPPG